MDNQKQLEKIIFQGFKAIDTIFHNISNGVTITDSEANIIYINPGFNRITGYSKEEAVGQSVGILHSGLYDKTFYEKMWDDLLQHGYWAGEIWNRHKNGHLIPEFLTISKISNGKSIFYIAIFSDITSVISKNEEKLNLAHKDPLTGLYNRSYFEEMFHYLINEQERKQYKNPNIIPQIALLFMDVNKFKLINDTYGHLVGDEALKYVAKSLKAVLRKVDIISRYGGDEFVAVLTNILERKQVEDICLRIAEKLSKPLTYDDHEIQLAISIGISFYPSEKSNLKDLTKASDEAMYFAKQNGHLFKFYTDLH